MSEQKVWVKCTYCKTVNVLVNSRCSTCNSPLPLPEYLEEKHRLLKQKIEEEEKLKLEEEKEAERFKEKHKPFWKQTDYVNKGSKIQKEHYYPDYVLPEFLKIYTRIELIRYYANDMLIGLMSGAFVYLAIVLFPVFIWFNTSIGNWFSTFSNGQYGVILSLVPLVIILIIASLLNEIASLLNERKF